MLHFLSKQDSKWGHAFKRINYQYCLYHKSKCFQISSDLTS